MNIWIFQTGEPIHSDLGRPRPMRAMNLANTLVDRGHRVTLWTSAFSHQEKMHRSRIFEIKTINNLLNICLVPSRGYRKNIGLGRFIDHLQLAYNLRKALKKTDMLPEVAFIGYPPIEFAYVATLWLSGKNVPTILDIKDQWPQIFVDVFPRGVRFFARCLFAPCYVLGRVTMREASVFSSISQSFLNWASEFSGRALTARDQIAYLSPISYSITDSDKLSSLEFWARHFDLADPRPRFFFVGSLTQSFDFQPILLLAREAEKHGANWQFVVCGDGPHKAGLQSMFEESKNVIFPGWIDRPAIQALAQFCALGLAPYKNSSDFSLSIPNKVIDYLSLGVPVLSSLQGETSQLIEQRNCGLSYAHKDAGQLFREIKYLVLNPEALEKLSKNAQQTYDDVFLGERVYSELASRIESIAARASN